MGTGRVSFALDDSVRPKASAEPPPHSRSKNVLSDAVDPPRAPHSIPDMPAQYVPPSSSSISPSVPSTRSETPKASDGDGCLSSIMFVQQVVVVPVLLEVLPAVEFGDWGLKGSDAILRKPISRGWSGGNSSSCSLSSVDRSMSSMLLFCPCCAMRGDAVRTSPSLPSQNRNVESTKVPRSLEGLSDGLISRLPLFDAARRR